MRIQFRTADYLNFQYVLSARLVVVRQSINQNGHRIAGSLVVTSAARLWDFPLVVHIASDSAVQSLSAPCDEQGD